MISTKRCNNLATPRSTRLLSGSLPIKKRTFQPFKMAGGPFDLKPFDGTSDGTLRSSDQTIHAVVSRDSADAPFRRESTIGTKIMATWSKYHRNDDCDLSSSEDRVALHVQHPSKLFISSQDRRYTGTSDETRCSATTTRGRACAYIAVGNSIYCNMHVDYDTNPPPRRGLSKLKPKTRVSRRAEKRRATARESVVVPSLVLEKSMDASRAIPLLKQEMSVATPMRTYAAHHETYENNGMDEEPTSQLLSMVSTDQWFHKHVRIGAGPLKGRVGHVERWGNGWVSVYISGVGLHNRRSFELYLHSYDEVNDPTEMKELLTEPSYKESGNACLQQPLSVSRMWEGDHCGNIHPTIITWRPSVTAQTVVASRASQSSSPIRFHSPSNESSKEPGTCNIVTPPTPWRSLVSVPTSIPLLNRIVGTVDEGRNPAIFYATPARVRSRRSVHKPLRFQETQMLENVHCTRKRSRSRGDQGENDKRSRYGFT